MRRSLFVALFVVALVIRLTWIAMRPGDVLVGEASNVSIAFAERGQIADAYFRGQGPTAHLLPISPAIAGLAFRTFGIVTPLSNAVLALWSVAQVFIGWALILLVFRNLGASRNQLLVGLAILTFSPFIGQETFDFRYWESGLAVCLGAGFLLALLHLKDVEAWHIIGLSALAAVTFFVSPSMGLGVYAASMLFMLRNLTWKQTIGASSFALLALALVVTPWTIRNDRALGSPVLLRSNLGMELALAYYPGAMTSADPLGTYRARIKEIHPAQGPIPRERMERAGGEVAYSRALKDEALAWIDANPAAAVLLSIDHLRSYFFPSPWQFQYSGSGSFAVPRAAVVWIVSLLGLAGLTLTWNPYVAAIVLVPAMTYIPFQPMPRYIYLSYGMLALLAAGLISNTLRQLSILRTLRAQPNF
jgi:hypothetical protein